MDGCVHYYGAVAPSDIVEFRYISSRLNKEKMLQTGATLIECKFDNTCNMITKDPLQKLP